MTSEGGYNWLKISRAGWLAGSNWPVVLIATEELVYLLVVAQWVGSDIAD